MPPAAANNRTSAGIMTTKMKTTQTGVTTEQPTTMQTHSFPFSFSGASLIHTPCRHILFQFHSAVLF